MALSIAIISLFLKQISSFSTDWTSEFDYHTYLDENELFRLYWTNLENDMIDFGIEAEAIGWIALGISPNGQMPGSDIAMGWTDDDGNTYLQDRYTEGRTVPLLDPHQNLTLIESEESDGMTRIRFTRSKYTCNVNDIQLSQGTTRLIWAFHETADPTTEFFDSSSILPHTNKGTQSLNLNAGLQEPVELEDDIDYFDVLMDNVSIPESDTTYYCKLFELPQLNDTHHIVKFEPIVEEGNEGLVHHLLAYACHDWMVRDGDAGTEGPCDHAFQNMPANQCRGEQLIYAWAIGAQALYMPEGVGLPFGGDQGSKYLLMEMHYDNPLERSDLVDSSGFRVTVTPTLRPIDAGIVSIGSWTNLLGHYIPAGLPYALNRAFMYGDCSQNVFPESGINVFASGLHQHTVGVASTLRIIREGQELEPIDSNWNYDFNYQNYVVFDEPKVVLPGDTLILDCYYDSSDRDFVTYGGESTREEMCFDFIFYYPAVDLLSASSAKVQTSLQNWMTAAKARGYLMGDLDQAFEIFDQTYDAPLAFADIAYNVSDSDGSLEFYNRLWNGEYEEYDNNYIYCQGPNGSTILYDQRTQPTDFTPYQEDIFTCDDDITTTNEPVDSKAVPIGNLCVVFVLGFLGFLSV